MTLSIEPERQKVPPFARVLRFVDRLLLDPIGSKSFFDVETLIDLSVQQFDDAQETIKIVENVFPATIYADSRMIDALGRAEERGVMIELISGPELDGSSIELEKMARFQRATLYQLDNNPLTRFAVVDRKSLRLELLPGASEDRRDGYVYNQSHTYKINKFEKFFESLKTQAQSNSQ